MGLRNPFKFAVQPGTDTIFINDVGENTWEEINRGAAGANYGWPVHEGVANDPPYVDPIFAYGHGSTDTTGCSITGGVFYHPATAQFPAGYEGDYFFADHCSGWIRTLRTRDPNKGEVSGFATGLVKPIDLEVSQAGELYYLANRTGSVSKIRYASTPQESPQGVRKSRGCLEPGLTLVAYIHRSAWKGNSRKFRTGSTLCVRASYVKYRGCSPMYIRL